MGPVLRFLLIDTLKLRTCFPENETTVGLKIIFLKHAMGVEVAAADFYFD